MPTGARGSTTTSASLSTTQRWRAMRRSTRSASATSRRSRRDTRRSGGGSSSASQNGTSKTSSKFAPYVSGYFPLVPDASPDRATLVRAWQPVLARLEALSRRERKPVLFTEIGYRSVQGAAWRQWEIPRVALADLDAQRNAYEAFFEAVWPQPWVMGAYPWKWFSYPDHGRPAGNDYDFEGKPAEDAIRRAYNSQATSASSSSSRR